MLAGIYASQMMSASSTPLPTAGVPSYAWSVFGTSSTNTPTRTLTLPASVAVNDFMLAAVFSRRDVTADGWTKVFQTANTKLGGRITVFSKLSTTSGSGQTFSATNVSGSSRIDASVYGFTWDGDVPPYVDTNYVSVPAPTAKTVVLNIGVVGTYCIPLILFGAEYLLDGGDTSYHGGVDVNSVSKNLTDCTVDPLSSDSVDGSRLAGTLLDDIVGFAGFAPTDSLTNITQSCRGADGVVAAALVVTCGKT